MELIAYVLEGELCSGRLLELYKKKHIARRIGEISALAYKKAVRAMVQNVESFAPDSSLKVSKGADLAVSLDRQITP
jgi:hypothetical protein